MDSDYDPQREAEAAMKLAMAVDGPERQHLVPAGDGLAATGPHPSDPGCQRKGPGGAANVGFWQWSSDGPIGQGTEG